MTVSDLAAAEQRGRSAAAAIPADVAHLTDQQRDYLSQVEAFERQIMDRRRRSQGIDPQIGLSLVERLVHRSVADTVARRLADALAVDDQRSVATFLPVYVVVLAREEATRPRAAG